MTHRSTLGKSRAAAKGSDMRPVTMYSTTWCGYCRRLKRQFEEAGLPFTEVDLDAEPHHGPKIEAATGGYRTVPTVEIDGELLVNPSIREVQHALGA